MEDIPVVTDLKTACIRVCRLKEGVDDRDGPYDEISSFEWPDDDAKDEAKNTFQANLVKFDSDRRLGKRVRDERLLLKCPCNLELRILHLPWGILVPRKLPDSPHNPEICHRGPPDALRPLSGLNGKLPPYKRDKKIRLRLTRPDPADFVNNFKGSGATGGATTEHFERKQYSQKSIGGLLAYMAEVSRLTEWRPRRTFGNGPIDVLKWLATEPWNFSELRDCFKPKMVFPALSKHNMADVDLQLACEHNEGTPQNLLDEALLIHAQPNLITNPPNRLLELSSPNPVQSLTLAEGLHYRLLPEQIQKESEDWKMLQYPTEHPDADASLLFIARVRSDLNNRDLSQEVHQPIWRLIQFEVREIAWWLMDKRGILYDSTYELEAGAQLFRAGIRHRKPAAELFGVRFTSRMPDFLAWDRNERCFVIEVDVCDGNSPRKRRRNAAYDAEGIIYLPWDPTKTPDLIEALKKVGFRW